jgi:hypothetical protein
MPIDKRFFDDINERMKSFFEVYPTGLVTLTIRTVWGETFNVVKFLDRTDDWLMFAYYSKEKSADLPEKTAERVGEKTAFPALTVPYGAIASVEFNPAAIKEGKLGFKP